MSEDPRLIVGIDGPSKDGDHACMVVGHIDDVGNLVIDEIATAEFRSSNGANPSVSPSVKNV